MRKIWSKFPIIQKVAILLSIVFILYAVLSILGQILFYGKLYAYHQTNSMKNTIDDFEKTYIKLYDYDSINSTIVDYSNENDSYIMIVSENGDILHSLSYDMTVYDSVGRLYRFSLDRAVNDKNFADLDLNVGDVVDVLYSSVRGKDYKSFYFPEYISKGSKTWSDDDKKMNYPNILYGDKYPSFSGFPDIFNISSRKISGIITKIALPSDFDMRDAIKRSESTSAITSYISDKLGNDMSKISSESDTYIYKTSGERYIITAKKILKNNNAQYIFIVKSLRSMDEAISIMKYSYKLCAYAVVFIVILTSSIFSGLITKPVCNISDVTKKMKNLDFSEKCKVHSQDELGILAQNINDMSDRLDNTIKELVQANAKLKSDIEREREIENRRAEFVAAISHELKTPIAVIQAYSEGLIDGVSGASVAKQEKYIKVIIDESKKMASLVTDMLEISKLESGVMKMNMQRYNLSEFTSRIAKRFKNYADKNNIEFTSDIEPDIYAEFDKYYLEQVENNFITNAVRYSPENGHIYITLKKSDGLAVVSVENEGSHIDESDLDRVWDRFYKADKSRNSKGTGLGLSIAKNILNLHNASYKAENSEKGVIFSFGLKI